jgi:hypothetical protein
MHSHAYSLTVRSTLSTIVRSLFHRSGRKSDRRIGARRLSSPSVMYGAHINHSGAQPMPQPWKLLPLTSGWTSSCWRGKGDGFTDRSRMCSGPRLHLRFPRFHRLFARRSYRDGLCHHGSCFHATFVSADRRLVHTSASAARQVPFAELPRALRLVRVLPPLHRNHRLRLERRVCDNCYADLMGIAVTVAFLHRRGGSGAGESPFVFTRCRVVARQGPPGSGRKPESAGVRR